MCSLELFTINDCRFDHVPLVKDLLDARLLIRVMKQFILISLPMDLVPSLWLIRIDWAIAQTRSLMLICFHCINKAPVACQIPIVSATLSLPLTHVYSAHRRTRCVGVWITSASVTTGLGNQKASCYILDSQRWPIIEYWISISYYSK
jgi:hypothetical protein